jgi:hypothetical protein
VGPVVNIPVKAAALKMLKNPAPMAAAGRTMDIALPG